MAMHVPIRPAALAVAALAAALTALAPAPAWAQDDLPRRKPGLWETTVQLPGARGMTMTAQECIDEKTDQAAQRRAMQDSADAAARCEQRNAKRSAGSFEVDYTCRTAEGKTDGRMVMKGDFSSRYTMDNEARFDPPRHGQATMRMQMEGVWKGACPADMKPGDRRMTGLPMGAPAGARAASRPGRTMSPEQLQQMLEQIRKQGGAPPK